MLSEKREQAIINALKENRTNCIYNVFRGKMPEHNYIIAIIDRKYQITEQAKCSPEKLERDLKFVKIIEDLPHLHLYKIANMYCINKDYLHSLNSVYRIRRMQFLKNKELAEEILINDNNKEIAEKFNVTHNYITLVRERLYYDLYIDKYGSLEALNTNRELINDILSNDYTLLMIRDKYKISLDILRKFCLTYKYMDNIQVYCLAILRLRIYYYYKNTDLERKEIAKKLNCKLITVHTAIRHFKKREV